MTLFLPKRDGLLAMGFFIIALATAFIYLHWGSWRQVPAAAISPSPALPDIQVPNETAVKEMDALRTRLNRLAYPHAGGSQQVDLRLFGYTPAIIGSGVKNGQYTGGSTPVQFDYILSFALAAGQKQLCLLDGQLYTLGAMLPDGGRILAIEPERVLIEKAPRKRWVYMQEPQIGREGIAERGASEPSTHKEL